jgi:hypothetical protein
MEEDSTSNVPMLVVDGTFMTDTEDGTVTEARYSVQHALYTICLSSRTFVLIYRSSGRF